MDLAFTDKIQQILSPLIGIAAIFWLLIPRMGLDVLPSELAFLVGMVVGAIMYRIDIKCLNI
jgi:hypothetical protein